MVDVTRRPPQNNQHGRRSPRGPPPAAPQALEAHRTSPPNDVVGLALDHAYRHVRAVAGSWRIRRTWRRSTERGAVADVAGRSGSSQKPTCVGGVVCDRSDPFESAAYPETPSRAAQSRPLGGGCRVTDLTRMVRRVAPIMHGLVGETGFGNPGGRPCASGRLTRRDGHANRGRSASKFS